MHVGVVWHFGLVNMDQKFPFRFKKKIKKNDEESSFALFCHLSVYEMIIYVFIFFIPLFTGLVFIIYFK